MLASILKAKHIPYQLRMSFDHIWVQYPGKQANALENAGVAFAVQEHGRFVFHWPANFNLWREARDQVQFYWTPAPIARRMVLLGGVVALLFLNALIALAARGAGGPLPLAPAPLAPRRPRARKALLPAPARGR